jgi:RNA polymerase sigma-70 factor (ECF subfamily)
VNGGLTPGVFSGQATVERELAPPDLFSARQEFPAPATELTSIEPLSAGASESSPERLAQLAKTGCLDSFEQLVGRYEGHIYNFLKQFTGNHHDAEDLTQVTFVKAYRNLHRYNSSFSFATWLFTIARRTACSHFRSACHFEELPANEESVEESPATALECKEERDSVWRLVRKLKPKQAEALWWRYAEGFSVAEAARIMGTNQIYVKVLLHRGRCNLSKILTSHGAGSQDRADFRTELTEKRPKRKGALL